MYKQKILDEAVFARFSYEEVKAQVYYTCKSAGTNGGERIQFYIKDGENFAQLEFKLSKVRSLSLNPPYGDSSKKDNGLIGSGTTLHLSYGKLTDSDVPPSVSNYPIGDTSADHVAACHMAITANLTRLLIEDAGTNHIEKTSVFMEGTPYEFKAKIAKLPPFNNCINSAENFAKYQAMLGKTEPVKKGIPLSALTQALETVMSKTSPATIRSRIEGKGVKLQAVPYSEYLPLTDFRSATNPNGTTANLYIINANYDKIMAESSSTTKPTNKPARNPVGYRFDPDTVTTVVPMKLWEVYPIVDPLTKPQPATVDIHYKREMFIGVQKVMRKVLTMAVHRDWIEQGQLAVPAGLEAISEAPVIGETPIPDY